MQKRGDRIVDIRADGNRWRVRYVSAGERGSESCGSEGEAREFAAEFNRQLQEQESLTVESAISDYCARQRENEAAPRTLRTTRQQILAILPADRALGHLRPQDAQRLYREAAKRLSAATHQQCLRQCRALCRWLVKQGRLKSNPFEEIEPTGKAKRGADSHPQHTADESALWLVEAEKDPSEEATVAICCLLLGRRIGDLLGPEDDARPGCSTRDLDQGGTVLRGIGKGCKPYRVKVPAQLQPRMRALQTAAQAAAKAEGRIGPVPLFRASRRKVQEHCRELCRRAGVTEVTPHGLRGTASSLAHEIGEIPERVAEHLNHRIEVNRQHYTQADSAAAGEQERVLRILHGGK